MGRGNKLHVKTQVECGELGKIDIGYTVKGCNCTNKGEIIKQHYVPRCYLKNFVIGNERKGQKVFVYNKENDDSYKSSIKNVLCKKGFYNIYVIKDGEMGDVMSVEKDMAKKEGELIKCIRAIENRAIHMSERGTGRYIGMSDYEKEQLAYYTVMQYFRTLAFRVDTSTGVKNLYRMVGGDLEDKGINEACDYIEGSPYCNTKALEEIEQITKTISNGYYIYMYLSIGQIHHFGHQMHLL